MADFEPVGVTARVEGGSRFNAIIAGMEGSLRRLGAQAGVIGAAYSQAAAGSAQYSAATQAVTGVNRVAATSTRALTEITVRHNNVMQNYAVLIGNTAAKVEQLGQKLAFLKLRNIENLDATTRLISSSKLLSNTLVNLIARKTQLGAELTAVREKYAEVQNGLNRLQREYDSNSTSVVKLTDRLRNLEGRLTESQQKTQGAALRVSGAKAAYESLKKATTDYDDKLSRANEAIKKNTAELGRLTGRAKENRNEINTLINANARLREQIRSHTIAQGKENEAVDEANAKIAEKQAALSAAKSREEELQTQILRTKEALEASSTAVASNREQIGVYGEALSVLGARMGELGNDISSVDSKIKLLGNAAAVLAKIKGAFESVGRAAKALGNALLIPQRAMLKFGGVVNGLNAAAKKFSVGWFKAGNSIRFYGLSWIFLISLPIVKFLGDLTSAAISFENAMAGVIKTVDGLVKENTLNELNETGQALARGFRNMALEIPIAADRLAGLGQIAGQLGVRGASNILNFVDVTAKLGVSTDLAAEDAGRLLAQIIAITGPLTEAEANLAGMTKAQYDAASSSDLFKVQTQAVGATIVGLGNALPTTEFQISRFTQRIAASAGLANIATADIFGIAAAFASVGIPAERGGTAVQKTLNKIVEAVQTGGDELRIFAKITGLSMEEFSKAFTEGGEAAGEAFNKFIAGLGQNKDIAIPILGDLELSNERVFNALVSVASATDTQGNANARLRESLDIARKAFKQYGDELGNFNALQLEAARRFATTESQVQLLRNQIKDLGITIGSFVLPYLSKMAEYLRAIVRRIEEFSRTRGGELFVKLAIAVAAVVAGFGPLVVAFGLFLSTIGYIGAGITIVIGFFTTLLGTVGLLIAPILAVVAAFAGLSIAFAATVTHIARTSEDGFSGLIGKLYRFGRDMILAFAKGMANAVAAVVQVLIGIGRVIREWLSPGSPPKIAPLIDKWGAEAMTEYLKGWLKADFDVFNKIADKLEGFIRSIAREFGEEELIPRILGTREAIAQAINRVREVGRVTQDAVNLITNAMGHGTQAVEDYAEALLELQLIQDKYAKSIDPINERLEEIADRQQEVSQAMRRAELEEILADPRASELVRELANLELEQIGLQDELGTLEDARDAELEAAQTKLDIAEATLDIQIKQNSLLEEQLKILEQAMKKVKDTLSSLGDIQPFEELDLDADDAIDGMLTEIDEAIDNAVAAIAGEFEGLVEDLKAIFAPLVPLWEELGATWEPIFAAIGRAIEGFIGVNPFEAWSLPSQFIDLFGVKPDDTKGSLAEKIFGTADPNELLAQFELPPLLTDEHLAGVQNLANEVQAFLDGPVHDLLAVLVDFGIIQPFGPLEEDMNQLAESGGRTLTPFAGNVLSLFSKMRPVIDFAARSVDFFNDIIEKLTTKGNEGEEGGGIIAFFKGLIETAQETKEKVMAFIQPILDFISNISTPDVTLGIFSGIGEFLKGLPAKELIDSIAQSIGIITDAFRDAFAVIGGEGGEGAGGETIKNILRFVDAIAKLLIIEPFVAVIQGIVRAIQFALPFVALLLTSFIRVSTGIIEIVKGLVGFLVGLFNLIVGLITGNTEKISEGLSGIVEGFKNILSGIGHVLLGIVQNAVAILGIILGAALGFVLGALEGAFNFLVGFFKKIPGKIGETFSDIFETIQGWIEDVGEVIQLGIDVVVGIFEWLYDQLVGNSIIPNLISAVFGLFEGFRDTIGTVIEAAVDFILAPFTDLGGKLFGAAQEAIQGFTDGISKFTEDPIGAIEDVAGGVLDKVTGFLGIGSPSKEFIGVGQEMMSGWKIGVERGVNEIYRLFDIIQRRVLDAVTIIGGLTVKEIADISREIVELIRALAERAFVTRSSIWFEMFEGAIETLDDFVEYLIEEAIPTIVRVLTKFSRDMLNIFINARQGFRDAGSSMMDGLRAGLEAGAAAVYATAAAIAENVKNIINTAMQTASPSKVFFDIGQNIVRGWEIGMISRTSNLAQAAAALAGVVSTVASARVASAQAGANVAQAPVVAAPSVVVPGGAGGGVNVDLGGQTINNGLDMMTFQILVEQAVRKAIG